MLSCPSWKIEWGGNIRPHHRYTALLETHVCAGASLLKCPGLAWPSSSHSPDHLLPSTSHFPAFPICLWFTACVSPATPQPYNQELIWLIQSCGPAPTQMPSVEKAQFWLLGGFPFWVQVIHLTTESCHTFQTERINNRRNDKQVFLEQFLSLSCEISWSQRCFPSLI